MAHAFHIIQIISAFLVIALILLQRAQPDVGGGVESGSFSQTRRGSERFLFYFTIVAGIIFAAASIAVVVL
jgi:protein translocase SecG subunit